MTVNDLLTATLKLIGVAAKTQAPSADETADAFARLNDMVDAWASQRTLIYQVVRTVRALVANTASYTIGLGGGAAWAQVRPEWIENVGLIDTTVNPAQELPVAILSDEEWAAVGLKSMASTRSWAIFNDFAYPNSTISIWPVPNVGTLQLALYVPTPVSQFANVNATLALPPGYAEAIRYNLALRLATEFGRKLAPEIAAIAVSSLAAIQRSNKRQTTLSIDDALVGTGRREQFNYISGESM